MYIHTYVHTSKSTSKSSQAHLGISQGGKGWKRSKGRMQLCEDSTLPIVVSQRWSPRKYTQPFWPMVSTPEVTGSLAQRVANIFAHLGWNSS